MASTWFLLLKAVAEELRPAGPAAVSGKAIKGCCGGAERSKLALRGKWRSLLLARGIVTGWPSETPGHPRTLGPGRRKKPRAKVELSDMRCVGYFGP